jgi:hypothetical protein
LVGGTLIAILAGCSLNPQPLPPGEPDSSFSKGDAELLTTDGALTDAAPSHHPTLDGASGGSSGGFEGGYADGGEGGSAESGPFEGGLEDVEDEGSIDADVGDAADAGVD